MKILLVGDYQNDARLGSAKVTHKLREEFIKLGHTCDALFSEEIGATPQSAHARQALGPTLAAKAIARAFRERGPYDVVDIASAEGFIFGLQRKFLGAYEKVTFISRSNGLEHLNYQRMLADHRAGLLHKPLTRRVWFPAVRLTQVAGAARLADKLILLNEADREFAIGRRWKNKNHIALVPHGVTERFLSDALPAGEQRGGGLLFCGTWTGVKGASYLADAFSSLVAEGMKINLTILGGGVPEQEIRAFFNAQAQAHLTIIPRLLEEDVIREYRRHDALLFPSTYEGFGMVLLEAMSQGLPVIATPVGSALSLVRDGETGISVPARDVKALASAIRRLMQDRELRLRLAGKAFELVREMTWTKTALKTLGVYGD
jgi:glycosyltransferase involved in cell wall biosynthesis